MIEIIKGSVEEVKTEMKERKAAAAKTTKAIRKEARRKMLKPHEMPGDAYAQALQEWYSVTKIVPMNLEGVVINYLLLYRFTKKLKGFKLMFTVEQDQVVLTYSSTRARGTLVLDKLPEEFNVLKKIPEARVEWGFHSE